MRAFKDFGSGEVFLYSGTVFMKVHFHVSVGVEMSSGRVRSFSGFEMVEALKAELVVKGADDEG